MLRCACFLLTLPSPPGARGPICPPSSEEANRMLPSPGSLTRSAALFVLLMFPTVGPLRAAPIPTPAEVYPRRALLITIHDYLYANPVSPGTGGNGVRGLADWLVKGKALRIPA